jgi:hypothetical protein
MVKLSKLSESVTVTILRPAGALPVSLLQSTSFHWIQSSHAHGIRSSRAVTGHSRVRDLCLFGLR